MERTKAYLDYLNSAGWAKIRQEKLDSAGHQCSKSDDIRYAEDGSEVRMCSGVLQVHHMRYTNLGHEPMSDLVVLCEWHHKAEHKNWEINKQWRENRSHNWGRRWKRY